MNGLHKLLCGTAWTIEMQTEITDNNDMYVKQKKEKVIEAVYTHGSCMLSLRHTYVPEPRNIEQKHNVKQTKGDGSVICLKRSLANILLYLKW